MITHLLYLHGFRSSPRSAKAQRMAAEVARHRPHVTWVCPQLPPSPAQAMADIQALSADWPRDQMAVIGSSLGGFYATAVAHARGCPLVVLNPAVDPARDLAAYIGEQTAWHDPSEKLFFKAEYIDELRALTVPATVVLPPTLAIIAKGDELLDWREMTGRYPNAQTVLLEGGDHGLTDFADHLDAVRAFLGWPARSAPA